MVLILLSGCGQKKEVDINQFESIELPIAIETQIIEYGSQFDDSKVRFELLKSGFKYSIGEIDTLTLGEGTVTAVVDEVDHDINFEIKDTQFPSIEHEDMYTFTEGDNINFKEKVKASDVVDGNLELSYSDYDLKKVGEQTINVSAIDKNGNETSSNFILKINKKVVQEKPANPKNESDTTNKETSKSETNKESGAGYRVDIAKEMFNLMNKERKKNNIPELIWSDRIHQLANIRAFEGVSTKSHFRPDGTFFNTVGPNISIENMAWGFGSASGAMNFFMNSVLHRFQVLNDQHTHAGVGVYFQGGQKIYVQIFSNQP